MPEGRFERLSDRDAAAIRAEMLRTTRGTYGAAAKLYERLKGLTAKQVEQVLASAAGDYDRDARAEIAKRIAEARRRGGLAAIRSLGKGLGDVMGTLGSGDDVAARWLERRAARGGWRVAPARSPLASVSGTGDVLLSRALHVPNTATLVQEMEQAIRRATSAGEAAGTVAQRLRDEIGYELRVGVGSPPAASIPRALDEIGQAAGRMFKAAGSPDAMQDFAALRRKLERWQGGLKRGRGIARGTLDRIDAAIAKGQVDAIERAVEWQVWHRERAHLELIVETETHRAWNESYIENAADAPWVVGFQWMVDEAPCELCEERSVGSSDGMPAGTYNREDIVLLLPPVHPHCRCYLLEVIDWNRV